MAKDNSRDPLPDPQAFLEEVAEFWDTHDTTDYADAFVDANVTFDIQRRRYGIEVEQDVFMMLSHEAEARHQPIGAVVADALRKQLTPSAG